MSASELDRRIESEVRAAIRGRERVVLAVSGGSDSMALLVAFAAVRDHNTAGIVATFDHGTGAHASESVSLVRRTAEHFDLEVRVGRAVELPRREDAWRKARWRFLRGAAQQSGGPVLTAHTQDDNVETVVMRVLRDAGARGIAGLLAQSGISRPLLEFTRGDLERYCRSHGISWLEDPANADLTFLRNRVRHELLPAIMRVSPGFRDEMLQLSRRAAGLRTQVEAFVLQRSTRLPSTGEVAIPVEPLTHLTSDAWALLWPPFLARAHVVADRRGIARLAAWTQSSRSGTRIPLSGGFEVLRRKDDFLIRRVQSSTNHCLALSRTGATEVGQWRFYPIEVTTINESKLASNHWQTAFDAAPTYQVRAWLPGDRMQVNPAVRPRRVARFFEDAGVSGPERMGWPVVVMGEEVVWIPGVRRGHAATARPGGPYVVYHCERYVSRSET